MRVPHSVPHHDVASENDGVGSPGANSAISATIGPQASSHKQPRQQGAACLAISGRRHPVAGGCPRFIRDIDRRKFLT